MPFADGRAFILDVSRKHAVINMSGEERIHMIVHGNPIRNEGFQDLITRSYAKVMRNPDTFWKPKP